MSDDRPTKSCSECCEPMDAAARFCPHCGHMQWQRNWRRLALSLAPIVFFMVIMMVWAARWEHAFRPQGLATYAGQIKVAESRMEFGQSPQGPVVLVVGMLKNESDTAWRGMELQARFFDPQGKLIDVAVKDSFFSSIQPRGEVAFKLRGPADLPRENYARCEVLVHSAEDARRPF